MEDPTDISIDGKKIIPRDMQQTNPTRASSSVPEVASHPVAYATDDGVIVKTPTKGMFDTLYSHLDA